MTITIERATIAEDGTLRLPKEALELLGSHTVRIDVEQGRVVLEARPRMLHEIEDKEERVKAFLALIDEIAQPTGVTWPENYNVRDDIYD